MINALFMFGAILTGVGAWNAATSKGSGVHEFAFAFCALIGVAAIIAAILLDVFL